MSLLYGFRFLGGALLLGMLSFDASALVCSLNGGSEVDSGTINIYIEPNQDVGPYGNTVFDASNHLLCRNESSGVDYVEVTQGTRLGDKLLSLENPYIQAKFVATGPDNIGERYIDMPVVGPGVYPFQHWYASTWSRHMKLKVVLLNPLGGAAEAINLKAGDLIATYHLRVRHDGLNDASEVIDPKWFSVNIRTKRDFGVPVGSCDVSSRNINVMLGDYPSDTSYKDVNLSIKCGRKRGSGIGYSISGKMQTETIFSNVAPSSPATGIGIELVRNGQPVRANEKIYLYGIYGNFKPLNLNLKARYALLNEEKLSGGNVQAVIAVNFTYD